MDVSAYEPVFALQQELQRDAIYADPEAAHEFEARMVAVQDRLRRALIEGGRDHQTYIADVLRAASAPLPHFE